MNLKKYRWQTILRRHHYTTPWGYIQDVEDRQLLLPDNNKLDALEYAKELLEAGCSSRDCSRWLSAYTGETISHTGFLKRIQFDNERFKDNTQSERTVTEAEEVSRESNEAQDESS